MNITNIKHQLRGIFSALAVAGALFALPGATADPPSHGQGAHGTFTDCEHIITVTDYGSYLVIDLEITSTYTGTLEGTWEGTEEDVFYPDGYATVHNEGTFTGSVAGLSGTVRITATGGVRLGGFPGRPSTAPLVFDKGTGDLASLRGVGNLTDVFENIPVPPGCDDSFTGRYAAQIAFGP